MVRLTISQQRNWTAQAARRARPLGRVTRYPERNAVRAKKDRSAANVQQVPDGRPAKPEERDVLRQYVAARKASVTNQMDLMGIRNYSRT
jgi:hypothetical protein